MLTELTNMPHTVEKPSPALLQAMQRQIHSSYSYCIGSVFDHVALPIRWYYMMDQILMVLLCVHNCIHFDKIPNTTG